VLWYSVVGILSLLLLHPLRDRIESRWIQAISKWFYLALVPLVAMLFLAIMRRINDYGVTEMRYFVFAMAVGLTIVMIYMIVSKRKDVRLIPIVICLLAFFSAFGPWSAFTVSRTNQQGRFEALLIKNGNAGRRRRSEAADDPSLEDRQDLSSIVSYLNELHGLKAFSPWLSDSTTKTLDTLPAYSRSEEITLRLGFAYAHPGGWDAEGKWLHLTIDDRESVEISEYDFMLPFEGLNPSAPTRDFAIGQDTCRLVVRLNRSQADRPLHRSFVPSEIVRIVPLREQLVTLLDSAATDKFSGAQLSFYPTEADSGMKAVLTIVNVRRIEDGLEVLALRGFLLLRRPQ